MFWFTDVVVEVDSAKELSWKSASYYQERLFGSGCVRTTKVHAKETGKNSTIRIESVMKDRRRPVAIAGARRFRISIDTVVCFDLFLEL